MKTKLNSKRQFWIQKQSPNGQAWADFIGLPETTLRIDAVKTLKSGGLFIKKTRFVSL